MKHKSGNIVFGIFAIIFSLVCIGLGVSSIIHDIVLSIVFIIFGVMVLGVGVLQTVRWALDQTVRTRGEKTYGTITSLGGQKPDKTNLYSEGNCYYVEFSYAVGDHFESTSVLVTKDIFETLKVGDKFPILLYKRRAVLDVVRLRAEIESH